MSFKEIMTSKSGVERTIRDKIQSLTPTKENFNNIFRYDLKAPSCANSRSAGLIGEAFGILAKAYIVREYKDIVCGNVSVDDLINLDLTLDYENEVINEFLTSSAESIENAREAINNYIKGFDIWFNGREEPDSHAVAADCILTLVSILTIVKYKIDSSDKMKEIFDNMDSLKDMMNMLKSFANKIDKLLERELCVIINPKFKESDVLFGRTLRPDIQINDTLYDIKTTSKCHFNSKDADVITGYAVSSAIDKLSNDSLPLISKFGFIKVRFDEIETVEFNDVNRLMSVSNSIKNLLYMI